MSKEKARTVDLSEPAQVETETHALGAEIESPLLTPEAHARETGNVIPLKNRRTINGVGLTEAFTVEHQAAAQMHGWNAHKQATVTELLMSRAVYLAALEATANGLRHEAAVSEFAPKDQPAAERKPTAAQRKVRR
jgi:hypothetical protein